MVAEHAGIWKVPGGDITDAVKRSAILDRFCVEIGRNPAEIARSIVLTSISYDDPAAGRAAIGEAVDAGFPHVIISLPAPYPNHVARWVADELFTAHRSRHGAT